MADLTSTAKIKRVLGIPTAITTHDTYIDELADSVDHEILGYCGLSALTQTTFTETFDIQLAGSNEIVLGNFPVSSVTYVTNAGDTMTASDWYLENRTGAVRLTAAGASFEAGRQQVEVEYTCGFADGTPQRSTLAHAASVLAAARFNAGRHSGMIQETVGHYRYMADPSGWPAVVIAMLSQFVRVIPLGSSQ